MSSQATTSVPAAHRRWGALVALSLLVGAVTAFTLPALTSAGADEPFGYDVAVTTEGPFTDGQALTVRVTGQPGMKVTNSGFCHPDAPPPTSQRDLTEWCTAIVGNGSTGGTVPADPSGVAELVIRAGVGVAEKVSPALGTSHLWTCDATSPCRVALEITPATGRAAFDTSLVLTYRDDDPTAACGGPAPGQIPSAAPDRLTEAWVAWTIGHCEGKGTATTASFANDGAALAQFEGGSVDLAYSGVPVGTEGFGEHARPAVHTPVALNATVVAVAGFHPTASSVPGSPVWRPIDDVRMSTEELNALLSGRLTLDEGLQDSLKARNPQLAKQGTGVGIAMPNGLAGPQATTRHVSAFLAGRMGGTWAYPNLASKYDTHAGQPLGAFADYNALYNSLAMINLSTGKPQLVGDIYKKLAEKPQAISLVNFYLTDLATARQLGITPVALQDAAGAYVVPGPASLAAAVPSMRPADDGTWALDPTKVTGAYPLTFVEYAVTPASEIVDEECEPDEAAAEALRAWVGYLAGPGQEEVEAAGLLPLPPSLRSTSTASIPLIAAAEATTGPCAPPPPGGEEGPPPAGDGPPVGDGALARPIPVGDVGGLPGDLAAPDDLPSPTTPDGAADPTDGRADAADRTSIEQAQTVASTTKIPWLPGPLGAGLVAAVVTLVGLASATSATGWLSGGRRRGAPGPP